MSDTAELVEWSLAQKCPLRKAHYPQVNSRLALQLYQVQWVGKSRHKLFDGVYVSGYSIENTGKDGQWVSYPSSGFIPDDAFAEFGGLAGVEQTCGSCPANIHTSGLAGCFGSIYQPPDHELVQTQLRRIVSQLGLEAEVAREFKPVEPLWRGLWSESPLTPPRLHMIRMIVAEMLMEDRDDPSVKPEQLVEFQNLLDAIDLAKTHGFALHTKLLPPGHTDCGIYTIYPHCPHCKTLARVKKLFLPRYDDVDQTCRVCGTVFSPHHTASAHRDKWDDGNLRESLGPIRFEKLARDYLMSQGETAGSAVDIVKRVESEERARLAERLLEHDRQRRETEYLRKHVFHGLILLSNPYDGCDEPEEEPHVSEWLSGDELLIALHRAHEQGLKVNTLMHRSDVDTTRDRYQFKLASEPTTILAQWRAEGCHEKFRAFFSVPERLLYPELPPEEIELRQAHLDAPVGWDSDENFFKWLSET